MSLTSCGIASINYEHKCRSSDTMSTAIRPEVLDLLAKPDDPEDILYMSDSKDE